MTEVENLVMEHLRAIRAILDDDSGEFHTVWRRMMVLEKHMATLHRRLERIEKCLDLAPADPSGPQRKLGWGLKR